MYGPIVPGVNYVGARLSNCRHADQKQQAGLNASGVGSRIGSKQAHLTLRP